MISTNGTYENWSGVGCVGFPTTPAPNTSLHSVLSFNHALNMYKYCMY